MITNDTYTYAWMEQNVYGCGRLELSRECPRTEFKRSNGYWADGISHASYERLQRVLLTMGGTFNDPDGAYEPEYGAVIEYVHRPQGAAMWFDLDYWYSKLIDTDWGAEPYVGLPPIWDNDRRVYVLRYAA